MSVNYHDQQKIFESYINATDESEESPRNRSRILDNIEGNLNVIRTTQARGRILNVAELLAGVDKEIERILKLMTNGEIEVPHK